MDKQEAERRQTPFERRCYRGRGIWVRDDTGNWVRHDRRQSSDRRQDRGD